MSKLNYATRRVTNNAIYQLARVADTLHNNSLDKVDLLEEYIDHELEKRSSDLKDVLEKVNTAIQSLRENVHHTSRAQQPNDKMIGCLNILQTQIQTMYTDQDGLSVGFKDLKYKVAGIRSSQHDLRDVLRMIHTDAQISHEPTDIFGFPQFKRLPPEIRAMIWDLAIPNRILVLRGQYMYHFPGHNCLYHFESRLSPPSVAQVCKEARSIACRSGRFVSVRLNKEDKPRPLWSWYDPSRDSLRLLTETLQGSLNPTILEITQCTQSVISGVDSSNTYCRQLLSYLSDPLYFPRLKVVSFISDTYKHQQLTDHVIETRLFSLDRRDSLSFDVDDEAAKKALIHRITKDHFSVEADHLVSWLKEDTKESWSDFISVHNVKWPHFLDHLHREWFLAKPRHLSAARDYAVQLAKKFGNEKSSKGLPVFRRVKLIERTVK